MRSFMLRRIIALLAVMVLICTQAAFAQESGNSKMSVEDISAFDKSVVVVYALDRYGEEMSQGSGFCVGSGVFLTNYHVIEGASKLKIETQDNVTYEVIGAVAVNMEFDLALIKTAKDPGITPLRLGIGKTLVKGQQVIAIGSPIGLVNTVSEGIVSGFRTTEGVELVQITAPITYGSSGSPLFDMYGDVVGINSAGFGIGNLNFAVSINHVSDWVSRFQGKTYASIPVIGNENYTKDAAIEDSEITNTLATMSKYYNNEELNNYQSMYIYRNEAIRKSYADALTAQFKSFNVVMEIKDAKIIKKTAEETLVRAAVSYKEKSQSAKYNDKTIRTLFYLKKAGQQWKIFRQDNEFTLSITRHYNYDDEDSEPSGDSGGSTQSKVTVVTPAPSNGTAASTPSSGTAQTGVATEAKAVNIKATDVKEIKISMSIDNYIYNKKDNKIYALNKANKNLIVIDAASKQVAKTVNLKYVPDDLSVSTDNKLLYIVNEGTNNIVEMKLSDYSVVRELLWDAPVCQDKNIHYHIQYYDGKLFLIDGKWAPSLWVLDLKSLTITDHGQNINSERLAQDKIDSVGDFVINEKNGDFYFWKQFGWSAGMANSDVVRYAKDGNNFSLMDKAGLTYPGFKRDPLDSPIMMVESKKWIVCKNYILNMANLKQKVYKFDENLLAVDNKGTYAVSKQNIYNLNAFSKVGKLPVANAAFYFFDASNTLFMVDNSKSKILYCMIK